MYHFVCTPIFPSFSDCNSSSSSYPTIALTSTLLFRPRHRLGHIDHPHSRRNTLPLPRQVSLQLRILPPRPSRPPHQFALAPLVPPNCLQILIEQITTIQRPPLGLGMELCAEDWTGAVDDALIAAIVEVDEEFLPIGWQRRRVDRVSVVLRRDVASACTKVERGDIVRAVAPFELYCLGSAGKGEQLVPKADTHHGDLGCVHQCSQRPNRVLAVRRVSGPIGDEDAVEVVGDFGDWVVEGEASHRGAAADEGTDDVFLDAAVDYGDMQVFTAIGRDVERGLGTDFTDKVDLTGVREGSVLVGVVLLAGCDAG